MESHGFLLISLLALAFLLTNGHAYSPSEASTMASGDASTRRTYIVRVRPPANFSIDRRPENLKDWYASFLPPEMASSKTSPFVYIYINAIIGFAVNLTDGEVAYVSKRAGFLKAYPDRLIPMLTTHTPDFLDLRPKDGLWAGSGMGDGVIIGVLDTGIDFAHASFADVDGMRAPPSKWRGACDFKDIPCNKKVIGAQRFVGGARTGPPTDLVGHGTHTASTAAGGFIKGANVLGNGNGTAAGMAPHAHLAIYEVCGALWCSAADILAGMDQAIGDGVDVMSLSLGGRAQPFYEDVIAIGAFSAMRRGVFVSCAAGNSGPTPGTLSNEAPWILTVGASTMDRRMKAIVKLGNGQKFVGESAYQPADVPSVPLVYPTLSLFGNCGALDSTNVTGKIVACDRVGSRIDLGGEVKRAGGVGMILLGKDGSTTLAEAHVLPASDVDYPDATAIQKYINSTEKPTASITFNGTSLRTYPAPVVAFFSSRGPSFASPGILKPDIIGPGVNVIAAWPFRVGPLQQPGHGNVTFNSLSGTSMSTPHLSGIAALIKGAHPDWSPAAIKSAIMTTSNAMDDDGKPVMDEKLEPASFFAMGAGHVNALKAINPGLVYDIDEEQYIAFLCGLGYTDDEVETITHRKGACLKAGKISEAELNYPSIAASAIPGKITVNRTVKNVGDASATYSVDVKMPKEVTVTVSPKTLQFSKAGEKKSFTVSMSWNPSTTAQAEGNLKWVSKKQIVRSPIIIN